MRWFVFIIVGTTLVLGPKSLNAQRWNAKSPTEVIRSLDVDRDGNTEVLRFVFWSENECEYGCWYNLCKIEFDGKLTEIWGEGFLLDVALVDIDSTDSYLEIELVEQGYSRGCRRLLRLTPEGIYDLGSLPSEATYDGSGIAKTRCDGKILSTWFYDCEFLVDDSNQLVEVIHDFVPMKIEVTLKTDLILIEDRDSDRVVGRITAGETAMIIGTDNTYWCLIETKSGLRGWFQVTDYCNVNGVHAGEVFDGLDWAG